MSRKTQHTRFEDKILRKLANEDKPQVVTAWYKPRTTDTTQNDPKLLNMVQNCLVYIHKDLIYRLQYQRLRFDNFT